MADKIRIGIIGAGGITQLIHAPIAKKHPHAELVAVADTELKKAAYLADKFGIPDFYRDPEKIFAREDVDAVHINTPTNSHLALTLGALSSGKHVLVEKPMARTAQDAHRMVEAAKTAGKELMVAMNLRFRPDTMVLRKFVTGGELGRVRTVRAGWLKKKEHWSRSPWLSNMRISGGGVLMDLGVQMLDVCLWVLGHPAVKRVSAQCTHDLADFRVEDTCVAHYYLGRDTALYLNVTWAFMNDHSDAFTIFSGSEGAASLNPLRITKEIKNNIVNITPGGKQLSAKDLYSKSFELEIDHFYHCLRKHEKPISPGEEGAALMEIVEATYRSASENREIVVGEA